ncbi:MAG TPA: iron-sulfur cluster biosynthesis family protein [Rhodocyclaceae bacterium]|nr:iron-sulfur cluster biosynthesis family protein [Rhodocyclaceae bacterium]
MFKVTPSAAEQILHAADAQDDSPALRVAAKVDDDGEISYGMGFDEERENDVVVECEGVHLLISPRSNELLDDATLDFVELKPGEFQFIFINPKDGACAGRERASGCGSCGGGCA